MNSMNIRKIIKEELEKVFESEEKGIVGLDILNHFPFSELPEKRVDGSFSNNIDGWGKIQIPDLGSEGSLTQIVSKEDFINHEFKGPKMTHKYEGYINKFKRKFNEEPIFKINPNGNWYDKIEIINPKFKEWRSDFYKSKESTLDSWNTAD
jgi:hypothetical protein